MSARSPQDEFERLKDEGYSPNDVIGKDGIEFAYDRYLRGIPGGERVVVDATGAVVSNVKLSSKAGRSRLHAGHAASTGGFSRSSRRRSPTACGAGARAQAHRRGRSGRSLDRRHRGARRVIRTSIRNDFASGSLEARERSISPILRSRSSIARLRPLRRPVRPLRWLRARRR